MPISFRSVAKWLAEHGGTLDDDELKQLEDLVYRSREQARARVNEDRQALEELAQKRGKSVEELLRKAGLAPAQKVKKKVSGVRRPYMNPHELAGDDESKIQLYFLADNRMPPWAAELIENSGWKKEHFHYGQIQERMELKRMVCKHDPVALFKKLEAAELANPRESRVQKRKPT